MTDTIQHIPYSEYARFVGGLFHRNGDLSKDFAHAVFGIIEELDELDAATDPVNVVEECGDLLFFATAAHIVLGEHDGLELDLSALGGHINATQEAVAAMRFALTLGRGADDTRARRTQILVSAAKKWVGYGHAPDGAKIVELRRAVEDQALKAIYARAGSSGPAIFQKAVRANIAKLRTRYPGGFNLHDSIERHLDKEGEALANAC